MWKLKLASNLANGPSIPGVNKVENTYSKWARICAFGTAALYVIMGLIDLLLYGSYVIGIICIILAPFIPVLEIPLAYGFVKGFVNFFSDYKFRVVLYVLFAIPAFFSLPSIVAAIASLVTAGLYGYAFFRGEKAEKIEEKKNNAETNNTKKTGLAALGVV